MRKIIGVCLFVWVALCSNAQNYNVERIKAALTDNNVDKAMEYIDREITENPNKPYGYFYRATIHTKKEEYALALSDVCKAIEYRISKDKKNLSDSYYLRGIIYSKIEEWHKVEADYTMAIKLDSKDVDKYINRAQLYFDLKQYQKAEDDYNQILKIDEGEVRGWAGLGRNYLNEKKYAEADRTLNQLIKLAPDYSSGHYFKALSAFEQQKYIEAIDQMVQMLVITESTDSKKDCFFKHAAKNYPYALAQVNRQIEKKPNYTYWILIRAEIYSKMGNFKSALSDYTNAFLLADESMRKEVLMSRADCYMSAGMYNECIADYNECLKNDSTNAYCYGQRADAKRLQGDFEAAKKDFTRAIELDPSEGWYYYRRGWVNDEFLGLVKEGLCDYNQAIALAPRNAYTYLQRGRLYEKSLKDTIKAKSDFEQVVKFDSITKAEGNCRQYGYVGLGKNAEAISWMNKILKEYPSGGNYYDATCMYSIMSRHKEAIAHLKLAFENGYVNIGHLKKDDDLDNIRNLKEYLQLLDEWQPRLIRKIDVQKQMSEKAVDEVPASVTVNMITRGSGTYEVPCKVNGLSLKMLFDTGASDISISKTEVDFMLKNNYLQSSEILGSQSYSDANGDISIGTIINLKQIDLGGFILRNVQASVVSSKNAPLLLGQSAMKKYGKIIIDNQKKCITLSR